LQPRNAAKASREPALGAVEGNPLFPPFREDLPPFSPNTHTSLTRKFASEQMEGRNDDRSDDGSDDRSDDTPKGSDDIDLDL